MQRNDDAIKKLLSLSPSERKKSISTLDWQTVSQYIHWVKIKLSQSETTTSISLTPQKVIRKFDFNKEDYRLIPDQGGFGGYNGKTDFITYAGTGTQCATSENQLLNELLIELQQHRAQLNHDWKNHISLLLYSLKDSPETQRKDVIKEGLDEIKDADGIGLVKASNIVALEVLEGHAKTVEELKQSIEQNQTLKLTLIKKDKKIEEQQEIIKSLTEEEKILEFNKNQQIKERDNTIEELRKQLIVATTPREDKIKTEISRETLAAITQHYDNKNYGLFSHVPETLKNLKRLIELTRKPLFTKTEIQLCVNDHQEFFKNPPPLRQGLSNHEKLICDLADAFKKEVVLSPTAKI